MSDNWGLAVGVGSRTRPGAHRLEDELVAALGVCEVEQEAFQGVQPEVLRERSVRGFGRLAERQVRAAGWLGVRGTGADGDAFP